LLRAVGACSNRNLAFLFVAAASLASCGGSHGAGGTVPAGTLPGTQGTPIAIDPAHPADVGIAPGGLVLDNSEVATLLWSTSAGVFTTRFGTSSGWDPVTSLTSKASPTLLLDGDGNATVVWWRETQEQDSGSTILSTIGASRYVSGSGWTALPGFTEASVDYGDGPGWAMAAGGHGQLAVVAGIDPGISISGAQAVHVFDPPGGWSAYSIQGGSVAILSDGTVMLVWAVATDTGSPPSSVCTMNFSWLAPGGSWTAPAVIDDSTCTGPTLLADHSGSLVVFYETQGVGPSSSNGSLVFRWFQQGGWTSPQTVATPGWSTVPPTAMGGAIAMVSLSPSSFVEVTPTTQQTFDLMPINEPVLGEIVQSIVMDATGRAVAVWDVSLSGGQANEGYYRRFDPSSGWTAPTQVTVSGGAGAYLGTVAINDSGSAVALWSTDAFFSSAGVTANAYWLSPLP